jgi:hypothetical protein
LLFGSSITGFPRNYPGGQPWKIDYGKDGRFMWEGQEPTPFRTVKNEQESISSDTGKIWIEGNLLCQRYQKRFWGLEFCSTVFRNPKGTDEGKDEYFLFQDFGAATFSLVR